MRTFFTSDITFLRLPQTQTDYGLQSYILLLLLLLLFLFLFFIIIVVFFFYFFFTNKF